MGRKRTIDRDALLDAAEDLVLEVGPERLTFDAVARRADVSKGGVLYAFPSKEALVEAMIERRLAAFAAQVEARLSDGSAATPLAARIAATRAEPKASAAREAALMSAAASAGDRGGCLRRDYRAQFDGLAEGAAGRAQRLAFLATEGAFLLRGLGLLDLSDAEWDAAFDAIEALAEPTTETLT